MNANLTGIKAALTEVTDVELRGLVEATNDIEQIAPRLLAWLEAACDWQLQRRKFGQLST